MLAIEILHHIAKSESIVCKHTAVRVRNILSIYLECIVMNTLKCFCHIL